MIAHEGAAHDGGVAHDAVHAAVVAETKEMDGITISTIVITPEDLPAEPVCATADQWTDWLNSELDCLGMGLYKSRNPTVKSVMQLYGAKGDAFEGAYEEHVSEALVVVARLCVSSLGGFGWEEPVGT